MELLEVRDLTARQMELRAEVNRLETAKRQVGYIKLNQDPSPYQEASEFTQRYQDLMQEVEEKANAYKQVLDGWRELEAHFGGVEKLRLALVDLATAEAKRQTALMRNRELEQAKADPERALLGYAKALVINAHKAKTVRSYGQHYLDRRAEEVAYAYGITTEQATAKAGAFITETQLTYNAKTETFRQTLSI